MKANNLITFVFILTTFVLTSACQIPRLPSPEEIEQIFIGEESKVIFVNPEHVDLPAVRVEKVLEDGELCEKCHPSHSLDPDSDFASTHFAEYEKSKPCSDCHSTRFPKTEEFPESERIKVALVFSHERHLDGKVPCGQCHKMGAHLAGFRVEMLACLECHEKMKGPTSCETCHPKWEEIMPAFHRGVDIRRTHGNVELEAMAEGKGRGSGTQTDCNRCHVKPNFCIDCHGIEMPHPEGYLKRHNQEVKGKPETCVLCHGQNPCLTCHQQRGVFWR